ncbi:MAG: DUF4139 domain-containing protein [Fimbriimonadaceae bacterium]|nr:DUF4139 domain-containing protein [Fimbriimonadaceae bacterium]
MAISNAAAGGTEVTIYNQGFALIKENRQFVLKQGRQSVTVEDVASMIEPSSVGIRSLTDPNSFEVLEQNYQFDLINPIAILNKSVGQKVRLIRTIGQQKDVLEGTLMSSPTAIVGSAGGDSQQTYNGMVIRTDDGRIVLDPTGEVEVRSIPDGLISKPTLLWDLFAQKAGTNQVELSYLTQGINWNADYVFTLDGDGKGDLKGWVTVNNQSGATYKEAQLKLLAGEVQRAQPKFRGAPGGAGGARMEAMADLGFKEESFFEYHLYTLQRPATIRNREMKQLSLLEGKGIKVEKKLVIDALNDYGIYYPNEGEVGTGNIKPVVRVEFVNSKENDLGIPLPKGKIKVYQRDKSGSVQMLGEDEIDHTPRDERLSLVVGKSFDVVATRKRTNYKRISDRSFEQTFEIEVRNRKETPETVHILERHYGDWKISANSMPFAKLDAMTLEFKVDLKAGQTQKVAYTVRTTW